MEAFLRCLISRGMFSDEVAVRGTMADGKEYSLFAPKAFVEVEELVPDDGHGGLASASTFLREKVP